ncbi:MAG: bacteriohemerythrin [Gammaproteobacteria bacterium]|nr:bacteriohemerythrin [Gammaproteobacteria bacterium]
MNSIDIFPWNDNFNTGIASIDEQHKRLVELLNLLASHVAFQSELPELNSIFDQLTDYTVYHFQNEEQIWHQYMPDDAMERSHIENHALFIEDILKLKQDMNLRPTQQLVEEILAYLTRWLAMHILDSDRYMAMVVQARQAGLTLDAANQQAEEQMKGSTRALIELILSVYETLSSNALHLMREISVQKKLEKSLIESEQQLRLFIQHAPAALAMFDRQMRYIAVSQRWINDYALDDKQITGESHYTIFPEITAVWKAVHQRALEGEVMRAEGDRFERADGSIQWITWEVRPWYEADGAIGGIVIFSEDMTAHKQVEENYRRLFELTGTCMGIIEADGRFSLVNRTFANLAESTPEALNGKLFMDFLDQDSAKLALQYHQNRLQGLSAPAGYELNYITQKGNTGSASLNAVYLEDTRQTIVSIIDITARKQLDQQLKKTTNSLLRAQKIAHIGNWSYRVADGAIEWSRQLYAIHGRDPNTKPVDYAALLSWIHPDDREKLQAYLQKMLAISVETKLELDNLHYRIIRPDGEIRWVEVTLECEFNPAHKPLAFFGTMQDVTERMQAEEKLIRNEAQLRLITSNVPFSIALLDTNRRYKFCNESYARLFAKYPADLIGRHARDILGETAYRQATHYMERVLNGEACGYELVMHKTSQGQREVYVHYVPELDADGVVEGFIATITDITEQKQQERQQQLRSSIHRLLASELPLKALLENIVLSVEGIYPEMLCSILLMDAQGEHLLKAAAPSLPDFYSTAIDDLPVAAGVVSCGTSAYTGKRVIVDNIATHPYWEGYQDLAESAGLRACWSQPIFSAEGKVLGTFAIYHRQPHKPSVSSLEIIMEAASLTAIALERDKAQQQLHIAATAFESQQGMLITDADVIILRTNRAFSDITGYTAAEVRGQTPRLLSSGRHDEAFYQQMWQQLIEQGHWEGEIWNKRKNGEVFPEYLTITAVTDFAGKVINYVASATDITRSKAAASKIENLAFYDPLTQLPNRRLMHDRLHQALASSLRSGMEGALLFIDLDNFKTLNDTLGHDYGDLLLQQAAHRLEACIREGDSVARFGGDEFIVMLENLSKKTLEAATQTEAVAKKILNKLNQPYMLETHEYLNSPSIGVTLFSSNEGGADEVLKQADIAMYEAKKMGRNTLQFFDPQMQAAISEHVRMEKDLRIALQKRQFQLYYQVQINADGNSVGAEALIRWIHPDHGMIPPLKFIPLAEETGLIIPLGQWILETACAQLQAWQQDNRFQHLTISINISTRQFHQADFTSRILDAIEATGIDPLRLKLELTESILLNDIEDTIAKMNALKQANVLFYLDDFGTGYSSLQYLRRLPLYQLKIDQSFTRDIVEDKNDEAIVRTIIAMAHSLELGVIAEGVETREQQQVLMKMGCFNYQGYYFGKPTPIDQFEQALISVQD